MPAMVNMLSLNENRRNDLMRTSTKVGKCDWIHEQQGVKNRLLSGIPLSISIIRSVTNDNNQIANPELRDKYQDLSDLSPISSPVSTIEKVGLSPIPAARLISPTKKQSRDSFANAMRNKHWMHVKIFLYLKPILAMIYLE